MFLILSLICEKHLVLDFGGKYMKGAIVDDGDGTITTLKNVEMSSMAIPCAITSELSGPLSIKNIQQALRVDSCTIGYAALKLIEKNRTRGIPFLGATFGKDIEYLKENHDFYGIDSNATFNGLPASWYLLRMLTMIEMSYGHFRDVVLILPFSMPLYIRSHLQVLGLFIKKKFVSVADTQVFGWVCSKVLQPRLRHGERVAVMIVDVGAFSLKVQLLRMNKETNSPLIRAGFIDGFMSEEAGLEAIAYRMSVNQNIKRKKAVKMLENLKEPDEVFRAEFLKMMNEIEKRHRVRIEQVQVVGGGARYKWVQRVLEEGLPESVPIQFNMNQITGLVDGCAQIVARGIEDELCMTYPLYVEHGDARIEIYTGNRKVAQSVAFPFRNETLIRVTANKESIPKGFDTTMYAFQVKVNMSAFKNNSELVFCAANRLGSPILDGSVVCSSRECRDAKLVKLYKGELEAILDMAKAVDKDSLKEMVQLLSKDMEGSVDLEQIIRQNSTWAADSSLSSLEL